MAKKIKSKWKWLLWGFVAFVAVCVVTVPLKRGVPRMQWRAPVHVSMPRLPEISPKLPEMPELSGEDLQALRDKVVQSWPKLPLAPLPYEERVPQPPELKEEPEPSPMPAIVPPPEPLKPQEGHGRIAIIIDDMGLVTGASARAVRLPSSVTLAYLPYAPAIVHQTEEASRAGHDLMLHMPMEPVGHENPGPGALLTSQTQDEWKEKIEKDLNSFEGYIGVNNHMGSKFTTNQNGMAFFSQALLEKGVFFIDSRTSGQSIAQQVAKEAGLRTAARDVFLDDTQTLESVLQQLHRAEQIARKKGQVIAIGHPHSVTLQALESWIPEARKRGFEVVPVRELVQ